MGYDKNIVWFAGLFEGEGCLHFVEGRGHFISVTSTDQDVLNYIQDNFGGKVNILYTGVGRGHPNWKDCYDWRLYGGNAEKLVTQIYPLLFSRRKKRARQWIDSRIPANQYKNRGYVKKQLILKGLDQGLTQREVATMNDVAQSYVSRINKKYRLTSQPNV